MKKSLVVLAMVLSVGVTIARGQFAPSKLLLPDYDVRKVTVPKSSSSLTKEQLMAEQLKMTIPTAATVKMDPVLGTPAMVIATHGILCAPAKSVTGTANADTTVKAFVNKYSTFFGQETASFTGTVLKCNSVSPKGGMRQMVWEQQLDQVPVFEGELVGNTTKYGALVSISSRMVPNLEQVANTTIPNHAALVAAPPVSSSQAVALAALNIGDQVAVADVTPAGQKNGWQYFTAPALGGKSYVRLTWLPMSSSSIRLCWDVTVMSKSLRQAYRVLLDAQSGDLLLRRNATRYISDASYNVWTKESPTPMLPGCSAVCTTQPAQDTRQLMTLSATDTNASPNGWINDGDNQTLGNNVDASTDFDGDLSPDLPRPQGSSFRVFDFPVDLTQDPSTYSSGAVVQVFYYLNKAHDILYRVGFDEASGNMQTTNFNRGGLEGDPILANAQSSAVTDNAFCMPAPDGTSPSLNMGVFSGSPARDSDFDQMVALHEFFHAVSDRLNGGIPYADNLQSGAMQEGWSDFASLVLNVQQGTDPDGVYPSGAYLTTALGLAESYYFGIRRYPYCTDLGKNPLTYKDIDDAQAGTYSAPISPMGWEANGAGEVHNAGEVWCAILWEVRAAMVKKYGDVGGDGTALQLVIDGLKLLRGNTEPSFIDARDAILLADETNFGNLDRTELWQAFAKRGLGFSAQSPNGNDVSGVVEAFDVPEFISTCSPTTVPSPAGQTNNITRTAAYWFSHVYSINTNCATLYKAIEANAGGLCLGFIELPLNYENSDSVKDSADTLIEAMGLYWRNRKFTGEDGGTQNAELRGSALCKARKDLAVELIAAIANNVLLGTNPGNYNPAYTNLIEMAAAAGIGEDKVLIKTMTNYLRDFNGSGTLNPLPFGLVDDCLPYGKAKTLKSVSRDPMTHDSCPGVNDSCTTATGVVFPYTDIFTTAVFKDNVKLTTYVNLFDTIATNAVSTNAVTNAVTNAYSNACAPIGRFAVWRVSTNIGLVGRSFTVDTFDSNFDTVIAVYRGSCVAQQNVACSDDSPVHLPQSKATFTTDGVHTYYIVVGGKNYLNGSLKVKITSP